MFASPPSNNSVSAGFALFHRVAWLLIGMLAVWLCSEPPQWLNCRCGFGEVKYQTARIGYGLIAARALLAVALRERSRGWIMHLILIAVLAWLIEFLATAAGGH